jgi:acetyltransferase
LLVSDGWHERGLGTELLRKLLSLARKEGIQRVSGDILAENHAMQAICRQLGFAMRYSIEEGVVKASVAPGEVSS